MGTYKSQAQITLVDQASGPWTQMVTKMQAGAVRLQSGISGAFNRIKAGVAGALSRMTMGIRAFLPMLTVAGLGYGFIQATRDASAFSDEIAKVSTMLSGKGLQHLDAYSEKLKEMSVSFGRSTQDLSDGLYNILSAGIPADKAIQHLETTVMSAVGGFTDLLGVTRAVSAMMTAYQSENLDAARATDVLAAIVEKGITTLGELAPSIGMVTSFADSAGIKLNDLAGMLATVTKSGVGTFKSVTSLRSVLMAMQKPTENNAIYMAQLNDALKRGGAMEFAKTLKEMVDSGTKVVEIFEDTRSQLAINMLSKNMGFLKESIDAAANSFGMADAKAKQMMATPAFKLRVMRQELVAVRREIGEAMMPAILELGTNLRDLLATPWVREGIKSIASGLASIIQSVVKVAAATAVGVEKLKQYWPEIEKFFKTLLPSWMSESLEALKEFVSSWQEILGEGLAGKLFWDKMYFGIEKALARILGAFKAWGKALEGFFKGGTEGFMSGLLEGAEDIQKELVEIAKQEYWHKRKRLHEYHTAARREAERKTEGGPGQEGVTTTPGGGKRLTATKLRELMGISPEEMAMGQLTGPQALGPFGLRYGGLVSGRLARFIRKFGRKEGMEKFQAQIEREQRIAPGVGFMRDVTPAQQMRERVEAFRRARPEEFGGRIAGQIGQLQEAAAAAIRGRQWGRAGAIERRIGELQQGAGGELKQALRFNQERLKEMLRGGKAAEGTLKAQKIKEAQQNIMNLKKALGEEVEDPIVTKMKEAQKAFEEEMANMQKKIDSGVRDIVDAVKKNKAEATAAVSVNCQGDCQVSRYQSTAPNHKQVPRNFDEPVSQGTYSSPAPPM